jgi:DNA-binding response OmpR family regulator
MNATVLVVEHDRNIGDLLRTYLERDGYRVLWVRSGEAGVEEIERHPVDLVILDVGLPGIDGFEVCRRIRARGQTPVIMLTARDEEADRVVGLELGADDYVPKPFSPRELATDTTSGAAANRNALCGQSQSQRCGTRAGPGS